MTHKIQWQIVPQSLATEVKAKALERAITEQCQPEDTGDLRTFTVMLSCTKGITFDESGARDWLKDFARFLKTWQRMDAGEVWSYRQELSFTLFGQWITETNDAQNPFGTDPAMLPESALTDEQKVEAATPGSPLTLPAPPSPVK